MNRRQILVLVIGILFLVELYLATRNILLSKGQVIACAGIIIAITGGVMYWLRDREKAPQNNRVTNSSLEEEGLK